MSSNDLVAIIGMSVVFAGVASLLWEGWQLRRGEAREIERNMRNANRAHARYLIGCAQRCTALPACRAAYLADARAAIARARSIAAN